MSNIPPLIASIVLVVSAISFGLDIYILVPVTFMIIFGSITVGLLVVEFEELDGLILGLGLANWITISREVIFLAIVILNQYLPRLIFTMLTTFILISDLVDGEVARSREEATNIGSILDIEADSSFNLIMTFLMISENLLPTWMILIGLLRYIYIIFLILVPVSKRPERRSWIAIWISIFYNVALCFLWSLPYDWFSNLTIILGGFIFISFGRDFLFRLGITQI